MAGSIHVSLQIFTAGGFIQIERLHKLLQQVCFQYFEAVCISDALE
jgi:hypothetical protein